MSATKTDLAADAIDDVEARTADVHVCDGPSPDAVANHRATITSANWAPASASVTTLLAVALTAPR
jgi:hypothetical protein